MGGGLGVGFLLETTSENSLDGCGGNPQTEQQGFEGGLVGGG